MIYTMIAGTWEFPAMGVVHKPNPDWASHIPALIKAVTFADKGPMAELGMGIMSTPLLHMLAADADIPLVSFDSERQFYDMFRRFRSASHEIRLVDDWDEIDLSPPWSVVLVDHKPAERRKTDIKRLTHATFVVIHDSQDPIYSYDEIYPLFKYRYTDTRFPTHTTVLSNKDDVSNIFHNSLDK